MTDLKAVLRAGDPLLAPDEHERLSQVDVAAMRRQVLTVARRPDVARTPWQQPLAVVAMLALTIAAGVVAGQRLAWTHRETATGESSASAVPVEGRRQFQFETPGGTRIIWVFDPEFQMKETVP